MSISGCLSHGLSAFLQHVFRSAQLTESDSVCPRFAPRFRQRVESPNLARGGRLRGSTGAEAAGHVLSLRYGGGGKEGVALLCFALLCFAFLCFALLCFSGWLFGWLVGWLVGGWCSTEMGWNPTNQRAPSPFLGF